MAKTSFHLWREARCLNPTGTDDRPWRMRLDGRDKRGVPVGWCVFAGYDSRGYAVFLMRDVDDKRPMVRVGCRYFTLPDARKHWLRRARGGPISRRAAREILMLIGIAINLAGQARYFHRYSPKTGKFLGHCVPQFDSRLPEPKHKKRV